MPAGQDLRTLPIKKKDIGSLPWPGKHTQDGSTGVLGGKMLNIEMHTVDSPAASSTFTFTFTQVCEAFLLFVTRIPEMTAQPL